MENVTNDFPDLSTQPQTEQDTSSTPDLTAPGTPPPLPDTVVEQRARRADLALGQNSPGVPALKDALNSGQEGVVRQQVAGQARAQFQQAKLNTINQLVYSKAPITGEHISALMNMGGTGPGTNPNTAIEDKFGQNYVNTGVIGDPGKNLVFQSAFEKAPEQTHQNIAVAQGMTSRIMQARNFYETMQSAYDQIPWFGGDDLTQTNKSGDLIKDIASLGFKNYVLQRNLLTDKSANTSLLPGTNKLEQIQAYYLLPHDQFLPELQRTLGPGSKLWKESPSAAMDMIRGILSYGTSDAYVDNAMSVANAASLLPVGSGLKVIGRLFRGREVPTLAVQSALQATQEAATASIPAASPFVEGEAAKAPGMVGTNGPPNRYFIPKEGFENFPGATPNIGTVQVQNNVPRYFSPEGIEHPLSRTPTEGSLPVDIGAPAPINTYANKNGIFNYETTPGSGGASGEGSVVAGPGAKPISYAPQETTVNGQKTIFVDKAGWEKLSQVLDEDKQGQQLLEHPSDPDKYFVADAAGKRVPNSTVKVSHTPQEGSYPIHLPEGTDKIGFDDFQPRITNLNTGMANKVTFGKAVIGSTEDVEARKALSDIVKSVGETNPQDALSKMGQHEVAAEVGAQTQLHQAINDIIPKTSDDVRRLLPSLFSPQAWFHNASSLTRDAADRIKQQVLEDNLDIAKALSNPVRVERMTNEALARATQTAKDKVLNDPRWNRNADAILDQVVHHDLQTNTYRLETKFGNKNGSLFDTSAQAEAHRVFQYRLGPSATVQQEGNQFYLSHMQDLDETFRAMRDGLVVAENTTPQGPINSFVNWLSGKVLGGGKLGPSIRSARYTLSDFQNTQRLVATHAGNSMLELMQQIGKPLQALSKNERQELERLLVHNRDFEDRSTGKIVRGMFYKSAGEFEQAFFNMTGHMPSEKQLQAYDTFVRINDTDWLLRAYQMHRDKARMGIRNYSVEIPSVDDAGRTITNKTDFFNAKELEAFPKGAQDANVYVVPQKRMTTKMSDAVDDRVMNYHIKQGEWKILQVANPREKPLMNLTGYKDDIHFIVTDAFQDKPLVVGEGLNYNPGGHVINRDPYFLKIPIIGKGFNGRLTHFGDQTFKSFATEREGRMWEQRYNQARDHLVNNREEELQDMFNRGMFPETLPEFKKIYTQGGLNADSKMPFVLTHDARTTLESNAALREQYPGLAEQWSAYNLSQNWNKDFLPERDMVLKTIGGQEGQWENVNSRLYDPYTALQRGMQQIAHERWMGDYRTTAAESWVAEFWKMFPQNTLPRERLEQNPWYWLLNAPGNLDASLMKTNPEAYTAAMVSRQNIMNFLGVRDEVAATLQGFEQKLIDWLEPKIGSKAAGSLEETILPAIKSAPLYARRAAFRAIDGIFNPIQLWQQGQHILYSTAISPKNGLNGVTAATLSRWYRYTEDEGILNDMFDKAANMGWDRGEIEEAYRAWKASHIHTIGGEQAMLNAVAQPTVFRSGLRTFLDKGNVFFNAGHQMARDTGFFTAYRDWRDANPGVKLDNRAIGDVLSRADDLTMNMTRAANAAYNEGLLSMPTQFWNWNARLFEQMLGKTLTAGEKARILTMYSAMYGIPATLGGATFGGFGILPTTYDDIRQYAIAHGYNLSNKFIDGLMNGLPEMLGSIITGHHTNTHRYSPDANQLQDIVNGKQSAFESLIGAGGGFMGHVALSLYPFAHWAFSALDGHPNDFPLKFSDVGALFQNISSVANATKAYLAFTTGKLYSKNWQLIDNDMDTYESLMTALGMPPMRDNDAFEMKDYLHHMKEAQDEMRPMMLNNWSLGLKASAEGDFQTAADYFTRTKSLAAVTGLSLADQVKLYRQAIQGNSSDLVDNANRQWIEQAPNLRNTPALEMYFKNLNTHYK